MKPGPFIYHDPSSLDDVVGLLSSHGDDCKILAGGQSLLPMLSLRLAHFPHLVDINRVADLTTIDVGSDTVSVGAMVRQSVVGSDARLSALPLLQRATRHIGHFQIRNRGTIGGSLAHADSAAEYPAVAIALGATMHARSVSGTRTIAAADFVQGMWSTVLEVDEVLTRIDFPVPQGVTSNGFAEIARRSGDYAIAGAAASLHWTGDAISGGRLVIFAVDAAPRTFTVEAMGLAGATATTADLEAAVGEVRTRVQPSSDIHGSASYRRAMAGVVARRALDEAISERQK